MADNDHRSEDDKPTVELSKLSKAALGQPVHGGGAADAAGDTPQGFTQELEAAQVVSVERRAHKRVPYDATVRCVIGDDTPLQCESLDLSAGGMLLRLKQAGQAPAVESLLEVCLMKRGDSVMTLEADVVRHVDERTFGVRFIDLDKRRRAFLARLITVVSVVHTGEYGAVVTLDGTAEEPAVEAGALEGLEREEASTAPALRTVDTGAPEPPPPPASLDELGDAGDVPRIVSGDAIDWHALDYRMVYLLSLITPGQLSFRQIIDQAGELAQLSEAQATAFLAELSRRGIIENQR